MHFKCKLKLRMIVVTILCFASSPCLAVRPPPPASSQSQVIEIGDGETSLRLQWNKEHSDKAILIALSLAVALGFLMVILLIFCCCCWGRSRTGGEEDLHVAAVLASSPTTEESDKLTTLKREKASMLLRQVMNQRKLQTVMEAILQCEAEIQAQNPPSTAEIEKKTEEAVQAANMAAGKAIHKVFAHTAPIAMQSQQLALAMEKRAEEAQEKARALVYEEALSFADDMQSVFKVDDATRKNMFENIRDMDVPSLTMLIASAFALVQIRVLWWANLISTAQVALFFVLSGACLLINYVDVESCKSDGFGRSFGIDLVGFWFVIDMSMNFFTLLVRLWTLRKIHIAQSGLDELPPVKLDDNPLKVFRTLMDYHLTSGLQALEQLDTIYKSWMYLFANLTVIVTTVWMFYALDLVINTTYLDCSNFDLQVMRTRCLLFLILLFINLGPVVAFLMDTVLESNSFQSTVIKACDSMDKGLNLGVPICGMASYAVFVRNRKEMVQLQKKLKGIQRTKALAKIKDAEAQIKKQKQKIDHVEGEIEQLMTKMKYEDDMSPEDAKRIQDETKDAVLDQAEVLFKKFNENGEIISELFKEGVEELSHVDMDQVRSFVGEGVIQLEETSNRVLQNDNVKAIAHAIGEGDLAHLREAASDATGAALQTASVQAALQTASDATEAALQNQSVQAALQTALNSTEAVADAVRPGDGTSLAGTLQQPDSSAAYLASYGESPKRSSRK